MSDARAGRFDWTPFLIGAAIFIQTMDSQALATILPAVARSLEVSPLELNLAITMYYVGAAAFLPVSGWCADRFGTRRVLQLSIIAFVVCSFLCGVAQDPTQLAIARTAMGAATAGLMPVGRLLLIRTSARAELVRRMTYLTIPATVGPLLGPLVGGAFATYATWRYSFFFNVPMGLIGLLLVSRFVPDVRAEEPRKFDAWGALLAGTGLGAAVFVIERVARSHVLGLMELVLAVIVTSCAVGYFFHARRTPKPVLDFTLIRIPTFNAGVVGGFFFRLSGGCQPFLIALLLQIGFGMSAFVSGALATCTAIGALLVRWVTPAILRTFGFKNLLLLNGVLCAGLGVAPIWLSAYTPLLVIGSLLFARGFFRSLQLSTLNVVSYVDVPEADMSSASSLAATTQQITQGLSIVMAASVISAFSGAAAEPSIGAISAGFVAAAVISLASLFYFAALPQTAGADVSGRRTDQRREGEED